MRGYVLVGCLISAAVDAGSGAMYDLLLNPVAARLVPLSLDPISASGLPAEARLCKLRVLRVLRDSGTISAASTSANEPRSCANSNRRLTNRPRGLLPRTRGGPQP